MNEQALKRRIALVSSAVATMPCPACQDTPRLRVLIGNEAEDRHDCPQCGRATTTHVIRILEREDGPQ